jgi:hypothetical protein
MGIKKEIGLVGVIIILIVALEIITVNYTNKIVDLIFADAEEVIEKLYRRENENNIEKLKNDWFEKEKILSYYIEHDELEKVTSSLIMLEENANNQEFNQALINGKEFIYWLNHFKQKDELILKNIL